MPKPKASENKAENVETRPATNQEALQLLDICTAKAPLNRQAHFQAQCAFTQLNEALQELDELKKGIDNGKKQ